MSNFTLPPCAQPDWAKSVTEDEWKHRLYAKLNIPHWAKPPETSQPMHSRTTLKKNSDKDSVNLNGEAEFKADFDNMNSTKISKSNLDT